MDMDLGAREDAEDGWRQKMKQLEIDDAKERIGINNCIWVIVLIISGLLAYWISGLWKNHAGWAFFFWAIEALVFLIVSLFLVDKRRDAKRDLEEAL